jgi:hypothetical protein
MRWFSRVNCMRSPIFGAVRFLQRTTLNVHCEFGDVFAREGAVELLLELGLEGEH